MMQRIKEGLSDVKYALKKVFLKPKKNPEETEPTPASLEDLLEPVGGDGLVPLQPVVTLPPPVIAVKPSLLDKISAMAPFVWFRERQTKLETGLTTRQRVKRFNAIMEGDHGVPEASKQK
jgi:hypothetical protein